MTGVSPSRLAGWKRQGTRVSIAFSSPPGSALPATNHQPRTTEHVPGHCTVDVTELELLLARQSPRMLAKIASHRLARLRDRLAVRARTAGELLRVGRLVHPAKRFSMADAALARVAALAHSGATNGSDTGPDSETAGTHALAQGARSGEVLDKRRLRGAERVRVFGELRALRLEREALQGAVRGATGVVRGGTTTGGVHGGRWVGTRAGGKAEVNQLGVVPPSTNFQTPEVYLTPGTEGVGSQVCQSCSGLGSISDRPAGSGSARAIGTDTDCSRIVTAGQEATAPTGPHGYSRTVPFPPACACFTGATTQDASGSTTCSLEPRPTTWPTGQQRGGLPAGKTTGTASGLTANTVTRSTPTTRSRTPMAQGSVGPAASGKKRPSASAEKSARWVTAPGGRRYQPDPSRPKSVRQQVLEAEVEELPADFVFPPPPVASVLDASVGLTYTEVMVDEPVPVVADGKCPDCDMRLQRGWCGRCRVRWPVGE